ncbi:MAG: CHASE2 domain-containing protein [Deltaproteobacteria bacterium]|nr:CHASE2 domain-containing protein [Deltaproteobacteria bacterium]
MVNRATLHRHRFVLVLGVALLSCISVILLRELGHLEKLELAAYDRLVEERRTPEADDRIVLMLESEMDLQRLGHPLSDDVLARLLERILDADPIAVVVDKYRDIPVPPGSERLHDVLSRSDRVVWVGKRAGARSPAVLPPPALRGTPRAACDDIVVDGDGMVRRLLLYVDDGNGTCHSLAFAAARLALEVEGMKAGFDLSGALVIGRNRLLPIERGDGPFAAADTGGFQLPMNYAARPIESVSFSDALRGQVPVAKLQRKIVFVGSAAESLRDFFTVPIAERPDAERIPGVELHALATATLLAAATGTHDGIRLLPRAWTWAAICVVAGLTAVAILCIRRWSIAVLMVAGTMLLVVGASLAMGRSGLVMPFPPPLLAAALPALLASIARVWIEAAERAEMLALFGRQVSREIADAMWNLRDAFYRDGRVSTQELRATVLFVDVRSFTSVTERLGPRMVSWLNRGLSTMTEAVMRNRGVVTRFVGDQIMAVFGVPVPRTAEEEIRSDARRAVEAALEIRDRLTALNSEFKSEGLPEFRVRIGLSSGTVTQGAVGSTDRFEFTVLGDVVNTAARLESYADSDDGSHARILISAATYGLCTQCIDCELLGSLALKGKDSQVTVFRVNGRAAEG